MQTKKTFFSYLQASYYIALGCNVVLCVQKLPQGAIINGEEVNEV